MAVEWIFTNIDGIAVAARIGQDLRPRIARRQLEVAFPFRSVELHTVVIRVRIGKPVENLSKTFVGTKGVRIYVRAAIGRKIGSQRGERRLVDIWLPYQVASQVSNIVRFDEKALR